MSYKVEIKPSGHLCDVSEGETVLEAALRQGFAFPYSCRGGSCGSCKGRLLAGEIEYPGAKPIALNEKDEKNHVAVFCQAVPKTDLVIEIKEIGAIKDLVVKILPSRVAKMERLAPDVMRLYLKLPQTERIQFVAGQYVDILLRDGRRRSFSLANAPHDDAFLELHVRWIDNGSFTTHVFTQMKEKDLLRIEGPLGSFFLREESTRPVILVAGGTGFAPMKAMVEHAFASGSSRKIALYWGARNLASLYLRELAESWAAQHANFRFVPVLSEPKGEDSWQGRTGFVHQAVVEDFADMSGFDVYASGPPAMVEAGRDAFFSRGLPEEQYFFDAFTFAQEGG